MASPSAHSTLWPPPRCRGLALPNLHPFANIERNRSIELPLERWPSLQEVGRLAVYFTAQAGESECLKGDIQSVLDTWAGHAEEVVASNRG